MIIRRMQFSVTQEALLLIHQVFPEIRAEDRELTETLWCDTVSKHTETLVAMVEDSLVGVIHGAVFENSLYISLFGVAEDHRRQGIGRSLFIHFLELFDDDGVSEIRCSDYPYGYVLPGVWDTAGIGFLSSSGFETESAPMAMERDLVGFSYDSVLAEKKAALIQRGYSFPRFSFKLMLKAIGFFDRCMASDWKDIIKDGYRRGTLKENGFCCIDPDGKMVGASFHGLVGRDQKRFGPIGVDPETRGLSIGSILLEDTLALQHESGLNKSYFLWCYKNSAAYRMYQRSGFKVFLSMQIMHLRIDDIKRITGA